MVGGEKCLLLLKPGTEETTPLERESTCAKSTRAKSVPETNGLRTILIRSLTIPISPNNSPTGF